MMKRSLVLTLVLTALLAVIFFSGRFNSSFKMTDDHKLKVVTTVAPLTNIVYNIGGDRINLHGLIPEGSDSHTFEPAPSDSQILAEADVIFVNGLHLETPTEKLAKANKKATAEIFSLGDQTISEKDWLFDLSFPQEAGDPNPHLWMNPQYARKYAELVRDELSLVDPANSSYYQERAKVYTAKLDELDAAIQKSIDTIPVKNRKLLTYHDSWAYFARRYGLMVIGAIQPADFKEPRLQEVVNLIDQLKREKVPAIFGSEVFPSKTLDQIAKEAGIVWVATLRDDDLPGEKTAANHTYIGMMLEDMEHMIPPLGGDIDALKTIDPANVKP